MFLSPMPKGVEHARTLGRLEKFRESCFYLRCRKALSTGVDTDPPRAIRLVFLSPMPKGVEHCQTPSVTGVVCLCFYLRCRKALSTGRLV